MLVFHPLPEPTAAEVAEVAALTHQHLLRLLARHGRSLDQGDDTEDTLASEQPVLASCYAASAVDLQMLGTQPGARTAKLARPVRLTETAPSHALAEVGGVDIHARTVVDGRDRQRRGLGLSRVRRKPAHRRRSERAAGVDVPSAVRISLDETGGAVILCSLTAIFGHLSLYTSANLALSSFGQAMSFGEVACLLAGILFVPALQLVLARVISRPEGP